MKLTASRGQFSYVALLLLFAVAVNAFAQSSGGSFQVTQSVIATGGDKSTGSGNLIVEGTAGQSGVGTLLRNPPFSQTGGFWSGTLGNTPTAAPASLSGRVTTGDGLPLAGVVMTLSGSRQARTITDGNGYYSFSKAEVGGLYTVMPARANYTFAPATRSFSLIANKTDAVFTAIADSVPTANPLDTAEFFVRQQYVDFLGREPEQGGFEYWSRELNACANDSTCVHARRIDVSAAFFVEQEFQQTGSFIYDLYKGGLDRRPLFLEYAIDRQQVIGGASLEAEKQVFAESFVQRAEFAAKYQSNTSPDSFIDALIQSVQLSGVDLTNQRDNLLAAYNSGGNMVQSRGLVVRAIADNKAFRQSQYNAGFVLTEYFAYLRRDIDQGGYDFWLNVLNNGDPGNYRGMVCSFITSTEYQHRFTSVVSRSNGECG